MIPSPQQLTDDLYKNSFSFSNCSVAEMQHFLAMLTQCVQAFFAAWLSG